MNGTPSLRDLPAQAGGSRGLPMFYREPVVLAAREHADKALAPFDGYGFSKDANAVPLAADEFMPAVRSYPIVFAGEAQPVPVGVIGLRQGENLFLKPDMSWREDAYVPAYIRRYPFIITETRDKSFRFLSVDSASSRFVDADRAGQRLFEPDGSPTPFARELMQFCRELHEAQERAREFAEEVQKAGLLTERHADIRFPDESKYRLRGFKVIDPVRYRNLPESTLKAWHQKGWTDAIALHLASAQNWPLLMKIEGEKRKSRQ